MSEFDSTEMYDWSHGMEQPQAETAIFESRWMQKPLVEAFEARVTAVERENQARAAFEAKLGFLEREEEVAVAQRDYDAAKRWKQEIDTLKAEAKHIGNGEG